MTIVAGSVPGVQPIPRPTDKDRLLFLRWLIATGDVDEGDAEPAPVCIRCRRPMRLTAIQVARVAQQLPITHTCGMPQMVGVA